MTRRIASIAMTLVVLWAAPVFSEQDATQTQVFAVEGMTCAMCGKAISKSLRGVEGVSEVRVDEDADRVTVVCSPEIDTASLMAAIEAAGSYTATPVEPTGG
jgi:copper chaperone CopZ